MMSRSNAPLTGTGSIVRLSSSALVIEVTAARLRMSETTTCSTPEVEA